MTEVRVVDEQQKKLLRRTVALLVDEGVTADALHLYSHRIPRALVAALRRLTCVPQSDSGYCVLKGILSEFTDAPGATPQSWDAIDPDQTRDLDVAFAIVASAAGRIFGWKSQQDGRLVHNIVPSEAFADMQVGASSTVRLEWHTEDSYHPDRPELLMLACVRNPDEVGTDVASIRRADLSEDDIALLSTRPVLLYPDDSYAGSWSNDSQDAARMLTLWETRHGLCMRYDPPYTKLPDGQPELRAAWERLGEALDRCATTVMAEPGDVIVVNNDVAAHARRPFKARYDGTDRWLKRILARGTWQRPEAERSEPGYAQVQVGPYPSLHADR
ncbi:TauD/TfdA family dioxygenase [Saccharopolyspora shandongensis]|uniref:TauD/TfdA family dioxygenase n=1 Tax=Saccharopolyspora shandongensis TaxID=418495 RepID=UPI0033EAB308